ncbi:Peptide chain release factor 1, mitochondrial [Saguinus oedipus]|uniref:Peptide chain release factor 1, mitochondrial n=1 Tax=Saguinus oedipus TaxID=9490 RepID=A0ABQ9VU92_SAGOE|nr:Peptide chain release factor 1, mitochondrial [Saguinus oedipus]
MLWKHKALQKYVEKLNKEYQTLEQCLQHFSVNEENRRSLNRRQAELAPLAAIYQEIQEAEQAIEELESMCKSLNKQDEKQLQELALEERQTLVQKINMLYSELFQSLVPKEKYDKNDVILEVTSGRTTGGDICQQFTREIFDMYQNYSCYKHWQFELLNYTPADYGGLHHAAARISGDSVYRHLKYEGGIHRVQRIPEVGLSSRMQRIHTGTMSVIILPQPDEVNGIISDFLSDKMQTVSRPVQGSSQVRWTGVSNQRRLCLNTNETQKEPGGPLPWVFRHL